MELRVAPVSAAVESEAALPGEPVSERGGHGYPHDATEC